MRLSGRDLGEGIRQVGFIVLLVAMLVLMVWRLSYFMSAALGGFTLYMLLRRPQRWLIDKRRWPSLPATICLLLGAVVLLGAVGSGVVSILLPKVRDFQPQSILDWANTLHDWVYWKTGFNIFSKEVADRALRAAGQLLPDLLTATGGMLVNGFMSFVVAFFMLQGRERMERYIMEYVPLRRDSVAMLRRETHSIVMSNALGIPIVVLGHSLISGLAYWLLGAGDPVVWGMLTGLCGLVPVVGTAAVWVPLSLNLLIGGHIWQGLVLIAYGAFIIANVDNVLRMALMRRYADVHPLITLFGIILGLGLFGFWGIIFGPLMISGFLLLLRIYKNEFLTDETTTP